jgi:hypothetical protein
MHILAVLTRMALIKAAPLAANHQEIMPRFDQSLAWLRRDLRTFDHTALYHALKHSRHVFCAFIFDRDILDNLHADKTEQPGVAGAARRGAQTHAAALCGGQESGNTR